MPIFLPLRSSSLRISGRTMSLLPCAAIPCATFARSAPLRFASITAGEATDEANKLPDTIACEVWPEPLSKTVSTSSPFFSKIFASLASQGIHKLGDKVDTPQ